MNNNCFTGEHISMGRGSTRIYLEKPEPYELRSMEQHNEDMNIVKGTGKPSRGVCAGPTPLAD